MNAVEETGVRFARPKGFDAREYVDTAYKAFAGEEAVKVVLHFAQSAAPRLLERQWHSTQKFRELPGGSVEMTLRVGLAPDLYTWIGGFFGGVKLVEPNDLRETMRRLQRRRWLRTSQRWSPQPHVP